MGEVAKVGNSIIYIVKNNFADNFSLSCRNSIKCQPSEKKRKMKMIQPPKICNWCSVSCATPRGDVNKSVKTLSGTKGGGF